MSNIIENQKSKIENRKLKIENRKLITLCLAFLICCVACDSEKLYMEEHYKHVLYLLSGSENVFTEAYPLILNEPAQVRYFSVGIGGSNPNDEEVVVSIVPANWVLDQYNSNNFNDVNRYARLLPASAQYVIELPEGPTPGSYTVTIPANPVDRYVKAPIRLRPHGLSPDTTYFIPLAISSVSRYEVNVQKYTLLYRVTIENEYARQRVHTYYTQRGDLKNLETGNATSLSGTKIVQPLAHDEIRMFAGNHIQNPITTTVADIEKYAIKVRVRADNTLDISPYGSIEVVPLDNPRYNRLYPEVQHGLNKYREFFLHYAYQLDGSDDLMEVMEILSMELVDE